MSDKMTALIGLRIREGRLSEVEAELSKRDEIFAAYTVTGDFDLVFIGEFEGRVGLEKFIREVLKWKYVERTSTYVALKTIKDPRVKL